MRSLSEGLGVTAPTRESGGGHNSAQKCRKLSQATVGLELAPGSRWVPSHSPHPLSPVPVIVPQGRREQTTPAPSHSLLCTHPIGRTCSRATPPSRDGGGPSVPWGAKGNGTPRAATGSARPLPFPPLPFLPCCPATSARMGDRRACGQMRM